MKALLFVKAGQEEGLNNGDDMTSLFASLQALGITHNRALLENMPSTAYINTHDFIVVPSFASGYQVIIDDAAITIPLFGLSSSTGIAGFGTGSGLTNNRSTLEDDFFDVSWTSKPYIAAYGGTYGYTAPAISLMTCSANAPANVDGGAAQANVGRTALFKSISAGGGGIYISALKPANHMMLPYLLAEAIKDGKLSLTPLKAPVVFGLDHINDIYAHAEPALIDNIAAYVPDGGVIWAGIYNAGVDYFQNMNPAVRDKLQQHHASGKLKYCWHDHIPPIQGENLDAQGYSTDYSKTDIDTRYRADKATWESHGLVFDEGNAYYNNGSTSSSEGLLELFSSDVSELSSPLNDTVQAGYGFTSSRQVAGSNVSRPQEGASSIRTNYLHNQRKIRGILLTPVEDMAKGSDDPLPLQMPYDTVLKWRKNFTYLNLSVSACFGLYMHSEDFTPSRQNPGVDQHGEAQMQILVDMTNYLKDVTDGFADLGNYVNKVEFR